VSLPRIADRFEIQGLLGRGGMASVYRAVDLTTGRQVAIKRLTIPAREDQRADAIALFAREYHTLAQLRHPRVIEVYDYGVDEAGPYYTMELLDGGDLSARTPVEWRECCALFFDVCSSLALLHSRRLLHHDISPRNIRCTRDGKAKLIDFGAMTTFGLVGGNIVGTPPFVSPESVHRSTLDASADLYSLGATLYFALTGRVAFPARTFAEVRTAWNTPPGAPSAYVAAIPEALDDLVLSLINLEPTMRPRSAFEVMQRLAAIAGIVSDESIDVSRAYLTTPVLVGRDQVLAKVREKITRALNGRGSGSIVRAAPGMGRSRVLDACALEAKTLGATVLRATATGDPEPFALALDLTRHLLEALPAASLTEHASDLREQPSDEADAMFATLSRLRSDPERLHQRISRLMSDVSAKRPLVLAVDDVHRIDAPSAALLATLADMARRSQLCLVLSVSNDEPESSPMLEPLTRRCHAIVLNPLNSLETQALLESVFGDVAHLEHLAEEIHALCRGVPRQCLDVAQHLMDRQVIRYAAGTWTLPALVSTTDLPRSAEDALHARADALSPHARFLAEAHALAFDDLLSHADYHALRPDVPTSLTDDAVAELLDKRVLTGDAHGYSITNRFWTTALTAKLDAAALRERHRALARLQGDRHSLAKIHHSFACGDDATALETLEVRHRDYATSNDPTRFSDPNLPRIGPSYLLAIDAAKRAGRPARTIAELQRWCTALSAGTEADLYRGAAPDWLEHLERDSGLTFWRADSQTADAGTRLTNALQRAYEAHQATPEADRVYRVDEAIPLIAEYVVFSIAVGSRTLEVDLLASLPAVIEPFAPLSPLLEAIWQNAVATVECVRDVHYEPARDRWLAVLTKLEHVSGAEMQHLDAIRSALAYGVGMLEASFGIASATRWADLMERDPFQQVGALYLHKIIRLEQGDWIGADQLRRQAELMALRWRSAQMFHYTLTVEISAHSHARDLIGVKHVVERMQSLAMRYPGWIPYLRDAEARFHLLRGDNNAARIGFEACIELAKLDSQRRSRMLPVWVTAQAGLSEALQALGRTEEARERARAALEVCDELQIHSHANELVRALALAEAKLGDYSTANDRLDRLIERQLTLGATGLRLGLSYEARAQIAIWSGDQPVFEHYSRLTAREYRHGARSPLGARYDRLIHEARKRGYEPVADIPQHEDATMIESVAQSRMVDTSTAISGTGDHDLDNARGAKAQHS
jgi:tetratricopeptide (TPR) repeat protein